MVWVVSALEALKKLPRAVWIAVAVLATAVLILAYGDHQGARREKLRDQQALEAANAKAAARNQAATDAAADQRVIDQINTDNNQAAETNAISRLPDNAPTDREFALACEQLRRQAGGADAAAAAGCRP